MSGSERKVVLWIGSAPAAAVRESFAERQLELRTPTLETALELMPQSAGIVFRFNPARRGETGTSIHELVHYAANHGLRLCTIADDQKSQNFLTDRLRRERIDEGDVTRQIGDEPTTVAEAIARHDPGPPFIPIRVEGEKLELLMEFFLRRAFSDCRAIYVKSLTGGRSASVVSVQAVYSSSQVGPRPLPFFAKFDKRHKVKRERTHYDNLVKNYIPFNLRPNLDEARCIVGSGYGLLVGNFVEQSESLREVARRGAATAAIYSLFDHALRGWRLQAYPPNAIDLPHDSLAKSLEGVFDSPDRIKAERFVDARNLGARKTPAELHAALRSLGSMPHRVGPIHGDLHAENVRVRGPDAILIDFNSARMGPIVADPASLEISLAFGAPQGEFDDPSWWPRVDVLYAPAGVNESLAPPVDPTGRDWLHGAVRQIRSIALASQTTPKEYQAVLAVYLLRRASFGHESEVDRYRRAYAYVIAERLVDDLVGLQGPGGDGGTT